MSRDADDEQRIEVAREFVAEVFNGHDAERARDFFTADIAWHGGTLGTVTGVDTSSRSSAGSSARCRTSTPRCRT